MGHYNAVLAFRDGGGANMKRIPLLFWSLFFGPPTEAKQTASDRGPPHLLPVFKELVWPTRLTCEIFTFPPAGLRCIGCQSLLTHSPFCTHSSSTPPLLLHLRLLIEPIEIDIKCRDTCTHFSCLARRVRQTLWCSSRALLHDSFQLFVSHISGHLSVLQRVRLGFNFIFKHHYTHFLHGPLSLMSRSSCLFVQSPSSKQRIVSKCSFCSISHQCRFLISLPSPDSQLSQKTRRRPRCLSLSFRHYCSF